MSDISIGYTGQRRSGVSGHYMLGNGYRGFNPVLKRFTAQDTLSPFGIGGGHGYRYCNSNPVDNKDPTGHGPLIDFITSIFFYIAQGEKLGVENIDILAGEKVVKKTLKDASGVDAWEKVPLDGGKYILASNQEVSASKDGLGALNFFAQRKSIRVKGRRINVFVGNHGESDGDNWLFNKYKRNLHVSGDIMEIFNELFVRNPDKYFPELKGRVNLVDTRNIKKSEFIKLLNNPDEHSVLLYCFSRNDQTLLEAVNLEPVISWVPPNGYIPE